MKNTFYGEYPLILIDPFDDVICEYSNEYHRTCLGNGIAGTSSRGPSDVTNSALELLARSMFRMKEDSEPTANVLSKQLSFQKEVKEKKKDKTEEWCV